MPAETGSGRLVLSIGHDPEATAARWDAEGIGVYDVDWADFLLLCLQQRVEGLALDALRARGWADRVSPSVVSALTARALLADARTQASGAALAELAARDAGLVQQLVVFKGVRLAPLYLSPTHRMAGDIDIIVPQDVVDTLRKLLLSLGYWEKPGHNGPTYFRDARVAATAHIIDVHVGGPPKYHRTPQTLGAWFENTTGFALDGAECRCLDPALELVEAASHLFEHLVSWIHVLREDDIRLIRCIDLEIFTEIEPVLASRFTAAARKVDLEAEALVGLALVLTLRGSLPISLAELEPSLEAVTSILGLIALPDGSIREWDVDVARRAVRSDRYAVGLQMLHGGAHGESYWVDPHQGIVRGEEPILEIVGRARAAAADTCGSAVSVG